MQFMNLGQTGLVVSTVGFGGIPIIRLGFPEAETVLRHAVDQGITFFDTANKYLDSEEKMGRAFAGIRDRLVIATKTGQRRAKEAMAELELSLTRLDTDYIDLYQPHQVSLPEELEALLAPGGAMEALVRAREQGKIRHIGITSHNLEMARKLVATGLFASVGAEGLFYGNPGQLWIQFVSVAATWVYCFAVSYILFKVVDALFGLRVSPESEQRGLDVSEHSEAGYQW